jgi:hypothetical protein
MVGMNTQSKSTQETIDLGAADLFVLLEQSFRRRKNCHACSFSLPHPVAPKQASDANWTVIPSETCSDSCRDVLEQLVARYQATYRLKGH